MATLQVVDQVLHWDARSGENGCSAEHLGIRRYDVAGFHEPNSTAVSTVRLTFLRFTGANRDAQKYRTREAVTQRFASGATASWATRT